MEAQGRRRGKGKLNGRGGSGNPQPLLKCSKNAGRGIHLRRAASVWPCTRPSKPISGRHVTTIHGKSLATSRKEGQGAHTDGTAIVTGNNCAAITVLPELGTKFEASYHDYQLSVTEARRK